MVLAWIKGIDLCKKKKIATPLAQLENDER